MRFYIPQHSDWKNPQYMPPKNFECGFCNNTVSSEKGYGLVDTMERIKGAIYICPHCKTPTSMDGEGTPFPSPSFGSTVKNVPSDLSRLYDEARRCTSSNSFTAAVLICRKILMHIGVEKGGDQGKGFVYYVEHLASHGYVPPNGKDWVDHIRKKSNEANHEIVIMNDSDAKDLIVFIEMLLKFIYEFPSMIPQPVTTN